MAETDKKDHLFGGGGGEDTTDISPQMNLLLKIIFWATLNILII